MSALRKRTTPLVALIVLGSLTLTAGPAPAGERPGQTCAKKQGKKQSRRGKRRRCAKKKKPRGGLGSPQNPQPAGKDRQLQPRH